MFYATSMPGWQRFSYPPIVPQEGAESLKAQAEWLKNLLDAVEKRINDLEEK
jgi:hypothetical protein